MNLGLSGVLDVEELTKLSDVNRVASNQNTLMKRLILQLTLLLRTGVDNFPSTALAAVCRGATLNISVDTHAWGVTNGYR
jgi:hypothetical protein